ncbi:CopG family transcriptional regulator [Haloferula helveola]|uniref:CopG family transcriptional regulator n=1 Tax=Haloferula helveola TaxID=490095 RepID=A0ABM7RF70_9BACT|nr:CopG family transcriptional regulator [Haloferula helveola]
MRTTVTIDPDTEALLKEEVRRSGRSFKEVLNLAIRSALARREGDGAELVPLFPAPFPPEFANVSMNRLADELDDFDTLHELGK